jgi:hypothetical protein
MACYYTDSNKPPKKWNWVFLLAIALLIIFCLSLLTSCDPYKQLAPQKRPPETTQDSSNLSGRCIATFPPQTITVKQSIPVITVVTKKDTMQSKELQKTIDSLFTTNQTLNILLDSVPDIDSLKQAIKNSIVNDCNPFEDDSTFVIHDTSYIYADSALVFNLMSANASQLKQITSLTTQLSDATSDKNKYFWLLIIAALGLGVGGYLAIKSKL